MKRLAILLIYFVSSSLCAQNVFKCKDPKGQTIYSDMPCAAQTKNVPISDSSFGGNKDIDEEVAAYRRKELANIPAGATATRKNRVSDSTMTINDTPEQKRRVIKRSISQRCYRNSNTNIKYCDN